jgi:hypothetical protein
MFLEEIIAIEDAKAERDFLESIGPIGRIIDNWKTYVISLIVMGAAVFSFAFLIGVYTWVIK